MQWLLKKLTPLSPVTTVVAAEPSTVFDVLTDYDNYLEWFPQITHSKLLVKEGDDLAIAEFGFDQPKDSKLTVECIHTKDELVLQRKIAGNTPLSRVQWNLASEGSKTRITLKTELDFANWRVALPGVSTSFVPQMLMGCLEGRLNAFASELGTEGGRKFLEIIETNDCLEVYFLGRKYKLVPMDE